MFEYRKTALSHPALFAETLELEVLDTKVSLVGTPLDFKPDDVVLVEIYESLPVKNRDEFHTRARRIVSSQGLCSAEPCSCIYFVVNLKESHCGRLVGDRA